MLKYLEKKYGDRATQGDKTNLQNIRNEVVRLEAQLKEQKDKTAGDSDDYKIEEIRGSEDESEASVSGFLF